MTLKILLMEYCCHIWDGAPKTHLQLLDRVEKRAKNLMGQQLANKLLPLSVRRDVASSVSSTDTTSANAALR